ncbi:MAG: quinolinate synthase NadA, partial [Segetibacter sp.]
MMQLPLLDINRAPILNEEEILVLSAEVRQMAEQTNTVILAHNYQKAEIQDVADYTGDSLQMARWAAQQEVDNLIVCGVFFMAETAAILVPKEMNVYIPDTRAGCSLADSMSPDELLEWSEKFDDPAIILYVNTFLDTKAMAFKIAGEKAFCCTSSNAIKVTKHVLKTFPGRPILFGPDMWLGSFVAHNISEEEKPYLQVCLGECHVHAAMRPSSVDRKMAEYPNAELHLHPECSCSSSLISLADSGDFTFGNEVRMLST